MDVQKTFKTEDDGWGEKDKDWKGNPYAHRKDRKKQKND